MASSSPPASANRTRIVEETIPLVASGGVRGATMRDIAAACGVNIATIAYLFGNKDGLIAECFAEVVERDHRWLAGRIEEARTMRIEGALAAPFLWTFVADAWGARRGEMLALMELWLSAPLQPGLAMICRQWLVGRRDAMRTLAAHFGASAEAFDILGLHLLSETSFAVSCGGSVGYRLVGAQTLHEAVARLAGLGSDRLSADVATLSAAFHADPETAKDIDPAARSRGAESRDRMIDAAAQIIEEAGIAHVTNRAVAERAGVSLALTTYHFKSVSDLTFAGILRVFEKTNAGLTGPAPASSPEAMAARIRERLHPSGVERLRSRGMTEISLAAARGSAPGELGLAMRRQRGTLTHAAVRRMSGGASVSRTRAASHALWSSAAFLTAAAIPDADSLFDFETQARTTVQALLLD